MIHSTPRATRFNFFPRFMVYTIPTCFFTKLTRLLFCIAPFLTMFFHSTPRGTRTPNILFLRQTTLPVGLQAHGIIFRCLFLITKQGLVDYCRSSFIEWLTFVYRKIIFAEGAGLEPARLLHHSFSRRGRYQLRFTLP